VLHGELCLQALAVAEVLVIGPSYASRRSMSAAARPAAPPSTITTDAGAPAAVARAAQASTLGSARASFSRTKTTSPVRSTRQQAIGSSAGARTASRVRRLKQA